MKNELQNIVDSAYQAWELLEQEQAAELFLMASAIEEELAKGQSKYAAPSKAFNYEIRAGLCLFEAGKVEDARPILEKAINFDWRAARLWGDRRTTEKAITCLLLDLADTGKKNEFGNLFDLGIDKGEDLKYPFPTISSNQKKLITACIELGDRKRCKVVINHISEEYLKKDKELKLLKSQAEKFVVSSGILSFFRRK